MGARFYWQAAPSGVNLVPLRVGCGADAAEGIARRDAVGQFEEGARPIGPLTAESLDLDPGIGAGQDAAERDRDNVRVPVALAALDAGGGDVPGLRAGALPPGSPDPLLPTASAIEKRLPCPTRRVSVERDATRNSLPMMCLRAGRNRCYQPQCTLRCI